MISPLLRRALLVVAALALGCHGAIAYVVDGGPYWTGSKVTLNLRLGGTPTYSDGSNPNTTASEAAKEWNHYMGRLQLATTTSPTGNGTTSNGANDVFFSKDIYGSAFGSGVLAVTVIYTTSTVRKETDVIVNQAYGWGSYRGSLQSATTDLRRVLAHEFGHVLGLDHPDEAGQYVSALMNAYVSDIESPMNDDQAGVASLYGNGVDNPPIPPRITFFPSTEITVHVGESTNFFVELNYDVSQPVTYQWRKNGNSIAGATSAEFRIARAKTSDAGRYSVVVKNAGGSATSGDCVLTVKPAERPLVSVDTPASPVYKGTRVYLSAYLSGGTAPFYYQWEKDGKPLIGENNDKLDLTSVQASDAGAYVLAVTNAAGTVRSNAYSLAVLPVPLPAEANIQASYDNPYALEMRSWVWLDGNQGPYTYQWYRNGELIADATTTSYLIPTKWQTSPADYVLVVTNPTGSTSSRTLNFTPPPSDSSDSSGAWIQTARLGDIAYFLFTNPARIERYDLAKTAWLATLSLSRRPTCFLPDNSGLYVAFGRAVSRFGLDGTGETAVVARPEDVQALFIRNGFLIVFHPQTYVYSQFTSVRLSDREIVGTHSDIYGMSKPGSLSIAPTPGFIYGRDSGLSPADLHMLTVNADGTFGAQNDSPYHGDYADAARTFVSPDESLLFDDSGNVYATSDLTHMGALGGTFDDLSFTGQGTAVVLRGTQLIRYDAKLDEVGRATVAAGATRLFVRGSTAFLFKPPASSGQSTTVAKVALSGLRPRPPMAAVNPTQLHYTPSEILLGEDQIVYLLARAQGNVFRWSVADQRYQSSIPLGGCAQFLTYSAANHALYAAYVDQRVTALPLGSSIVETPFTTTSATILGLSSGGGYVFVNDATSPWTSYYTFGGNGSLIDRKAWSEQSRMFVWNDSKRRFYHFRDDSSPNDLIYTEVMEDGTFGQELDSPYHGEIDIRYPIIASPNGETVLLGSGVFYNADTLRQDNALPVVIDGAAWLGTRLFTARATSGGTCIERWGGSNYGLDKSVTVPGIFLKMFALSTSKLLVVLQQGGAPRFVTFNAALASDLSLNQPPKVTPPKDQFIAKNESSSTLRFSVGDRETAPERLTITWQSSNPALIPTSSLSVSGTGASRSLKITPTHDGVGTARITLTVSDGNLSTDATFRVAVKSRPTISAIANQTTDEDKSVGPIAFTVVSENFGSPDPVLTAKSSDPAVVPDKNITFGGFGTDRTVKVKPASNASGSATITLTSTSAGLSATRKFKVTVKPINDAPTISALASLVISKNSISAAVPFQVTDPDTPAASLIVTAVSSDTGLIPSSGIALAGTGANRTLQIRPAKNKAGTARITLTVSDGILKRTASFEVRVNTPPTITKIATQTIAKNTKTAVLSFTIGDSERSANQLTLTADSSNHALFPLAGIVVGGSDAHRTIQVTPATGKTGSAKITLRVSDGDVATATAFSIKVSSTGK